MLQAKKCLGKIHTGVTAPYLIEADDGEAYVVKLKNNRLGTKVLVNEHIAGCFAARMDLCFPSSSPIEFTESFIAQSGSMRRAGAGTGLHFASRYLRHAQYVHRYHMEFVKNKRKIAGVMLFDHLMHNADRTLNGKNMLIQQAADGYIFYAIDNSHLFGSGRWRTEHLPALAERIQVNRRRAYGTLLKHYLHPEDFTPYAEQFQAMDAAKIASVIDSIPREWLDDVPARAALQQLLLRRCEIADRIAAKLIEFIPNIHRSS